MKDELVRFGVAMDASLLEDFDQLVRARGGTRSEILRDLARSEVQKGRTREHVPAVGTLTLVYDHHVRDLTERLTEMQHALGEKVRSTLHVHLDHHRCLEVIVLRGFADEIRGEAERLLATRGVMHGGLELYADRADAPQASAREEAVRGRAHGHERGTRSTTHHAHGDEHVHDSGPKHVPVHAKPSQRPTVARPPKRVKGSR
jgi:CopG family nickel-responsive transcriptional regulator